MLSLVLPMVSCGSSRKALPQPDPRSLTLRRNDLPGDFVEVRHGYWTSAQLAKRTGTPQNVYQQHGLTRAYESSFSRLTHAGLARVADFVYEFHDPSDAQWFIARLRGDARARGYKPFHFNLSLGDETYSYILHPRFNGLRGVEYVVYYRRQSTVATIIGAGQDNGTVVSAELVPFVGSVDLRAKAAYRS